MQTSKGETKLSLFFSGSYIKKRFQMRIKSGKNNENKKKSSKPKTEYALVQR